MKPERLPSGSGENVRVKSITVMVGSELHRRARKRAAECGTTLTAVVRDFLVRWSGEETDFERLKRLQDETLREIDSFRAGDRLSREDAHRRGGLR